MSGQMTMPPSQDMHDMQQYQDSDDQYAQVSEQFRKASNEIKSLYKGTQIEGKIAILILGACSEDKINKLVQNGKIKMAKNQKTKFPEIVKNYFLTVKKTTSFSLDKIFEAINKSLNHLTKNQIGRLIVKEPIKEKLKNQIIKAIKYLCISCNCDYEQDASQTISGEVCATLTLDILQKPDIKKHISQIEQRLRGFIQSFECFNKLKESGGVDMQFLKKEFAIQFIAETSPFLKPEPMEQLLKKFMESPDFNFMSQRNLSDEQKQKIFQIVWSPKKKLIELWHNSNIKNSLQMNKNKDIQKILKFIESKARLSAEEVKEVEGYLEKFDLQNVFDRIDQLRPLKKSIYNEINTNPYYVKALKNKNKCQIKEMIEAKINIRRKLMQLKQSIPFAFWNKIQDSIMKNQIKIIEKYIYDQDQRKMFKEWIEINLQSYYELMIKKETLQEKTKLQLEKYLINQNIASLNYKDIEQLVKELLEFPNSYVINSYPKLSPYDMKAIREGGLQKLPSFIEYRDLNKIDIIQAKAKVEGEMWNILSNLNRKHNINYPFNIQQKIVKDYLDKPRNSVIYQMKEINEDYKDLITENFNKSTEVKYYRKCLENIEIINIEKNYKKMIEEIEKSEQFFEMIKQSIFFYGKLPLKDNEQCDVDPVKLLQGNQEITNLEMMNINDRKKLRSTQNTEEFKQFKSILPKSGQIKKEELINKFNYTVKKLINQNQKFEKMGNYLFQQLKQRSNQTVQTILNDPKLVFVKNPAFKDRVEREEEYRNLINIEKIRSRNMKEISNIDYVNKVKELLDHECLKFLQPDIKNQLIKEILQNNIDVVKKSSKLSLDQMNKIILFIKESPEYKSYIKVEKQNPEIVREQKPSAKNEKKTKEIAGEKVQAKVEKQKQKQQEKTSKEKDPEKGPEKSPEKGPVVQAQTYSVTDIVSECDKIASLKEKSHYKKLKEDYPNLMETLLKCYPWPSEDCVSFLTTAKPVQKTGILKEMRLLLQNPNFKAEILKVYP